MMIKSIKKSARKIIAAVLVLILIGAFFRDDLVKQYVRLNRDALERFAVATLAEDEDALEYGTLETAAWKQAGVVEFYIRRSTAFGGQEKGFYYSDADEPVSFQAGGYPLTETGAGWSWTDPGGNHGYTERILPHWFWYEAVL